MQAQTALVVDDSRVARLTLKKMLQSRGLEVTEAASGEEALELLQSGIPYPSIIFMDVMMAGMDGITATRQLKSDEKTKHIPVVMCTGNDTETEREKAVSTGAIAVLSKPAAVSSLEAILSTLEQQIEVAVEMEVPTGEAAMAVDEQALIEAVMVRIKTDLMPDVQGEITEIIDDISRQIAASSIEEMIKERSTSLVESISGQIIETSSNQLKQVAEEAVSESLKEQTAILVENVTQQAIEAVSIQAKHVLDTVKESRKEDSAARQAIEDSIQSVATEVTENYLEDSLQEKVIQHLDEDGAKWLQKQEADIVSKLSENVNEEAIATVLAYLETEMEPLVTPVVNDAIRNNPQSDNIPTSLSGLFGWPLRKHLDILTGTVIGLCVIVLILIIV